MSPALQFLALQLPCDEKQPLLEVRWKFAARVDVVGESPTEVAAAFPLSLWVCMHHVYMYTGITSCTMPASLCLDNAKPSLTTPPKAWTLTLVTC